MTPRNVRLNNPGNIEKSEIKWQGAADDQPDPRFVNFRTPQFGFRALARNLMNYQAHDGCRTVRQLISRHAPASENPTNTYVATVATALGVQPDDAVDVDAAGVMLPLCRTIARVESGLPQPWPDSVICEGIHMAGVADAPAVPLRRQPAFVAKAAAVGATGVGACVDYCEQLVADPAKLHDLSNQVKDTAGQFEGFGSVFDHVKTALLTVAGGLLLASVGFSILKQRAS